MLLLHQLSAQDIYTDLVCSIWGTCWSEHHNCKTISTGNHVTENSWHTWFAELFISSVAATVRLTEIRSRPPNIPNHLFCSYNIFISTTPQFVRFQNAEHTCLRRVLPEPVQMYVFLKTAVKEKGQIFKRIVNSIRVSWTRQALRRCCFGTNAQRPICTTVQEKKIQKRLT